MIVGIIRTPMRFILLVPERIVYAPRDEAVRRINRPMKLEK